MFWKPLELHVFAPITLCKKPATMELVATMKKRNVFTLLLALGLLFALYTAYNNHAYEVRLANVDKAEKAEKAVAVWPSPGDCIQIEFTGQGRMNKGEKVVMQGRYTGGSATQAFMKVTKIIGADSAILPEYGTTAYQGSEVQLPKEQITQCTNN